jgi:hypothetical protein
MNTKNIIVVIVLLIVGFIAFQYLTGSNTNSTSSLSVDGNTTNSTDAQQIYSLLQEMAQVKLDDSIFSKPVFQNLKDNSVTFAPEAAGRNNPFSPIGSDLLSSTPTATTTK